MSLVHERKLPFAKKYIFIPERARDVPQPISRKGMVPRSSRYKPEPPTPQQDKAMAYIRSELAAGRPFPSSANIGRHLRHKYPSGADHILHSLTLRGLVKRLPKGTRDERGYIIRWRLTSESDMANPHAREKSRI